MLGRRAFFKYTAGGLVALYVAGHGSTRVAVGDPIPGGSLDVGSLPQFTSPLLIPPVMPRARRRVVRGGRNVDEYEIAVRQFEQQVLPAGLPRTTVWGYGAVAADRQGRDLLGVFHAPSLTIEAKVGTPVRVRWINELVDAEGRYLPHLLPVDPTLHWANPGTLGHTHTDTKPDLTGRTYIPTRSPDDEIDEATQYTRYWGPVPLVTHVHGAVGVGDESDGYPEAWYLPDATNLGDHTPHGTWWPFFARKAARRFDVDWGPGYAVAQYPNENRASTIWYHDHALGLTRLNVYAGPAGFFILRGGPAGDDSVRDARTSAKAVLPGPAPRYGAPATERVRDIPLAIQDRSFNADGSLFYPDTRAFFDGYEGPYLPEEGSETPPLWNPEFFGNTLIVNGRTWPFLTVERRRYRFRVLNGCQSRFLILDFSDIPGVSAWQIGNEGGLLPAPVDLSSRHGGRLLLGPAERADLIVDFARVPLGPHELRNVGPDEPYGGGEPGVDFEPSDPATTGKVLQFRVVRAREADDTTPPQHLRLPGIAALPEASVTRRLALLEHAHGGGGPTAAVLGIVTDAGHAHGQMWSDEVTTNPKVGATEVWEVYNLTGDAHPIHVHEVTFEVLGRQDIDVDDEEVSVREGSTPEPPHPWERGRKDTVVALPEQVTRIRATFNEAGQYVWHCHILEHEDNEMMLPFRVGPEQHGQPGAHH